MINLFTQNLQNSENSFKRPLNINIILTISKNIFIGYENIELIIWYSFNSKKYQHLFMNINTRK